MTEDKKTRANRELDKRERLREKILLNIEATTEDHEKDFVVIHKGEACEVPSYSTKLLTSEDQLLLAVDKIAFPELKAAFEPRQENADGEVHLMFVSLFSLNNGDKQALAALLKAFPKKEKEQYEISVEGNSRMNVKMTASGSHEISFMFSLCESTDGEAECGIPHVSASFSVLQANDKIKYTSGIAWEYRIAVLNEKGKLPSDSVLKEQYKTLQTAMRASLSFLGVVPSRL